MGSIGSAYETINPDNISKADLAVFIPSYNEAKNIGLVVKKAALGLSKYFPNLTSVVVNCDNHSLDGTKEAFFAAECELPRLYLSTPPGFRGKGGNLRNAFQAAADLSAKGVAVVDANLISLKTVWFKNLLEPIISGQADYVTPFYVRHRYDTPLTRILIYPMMRALFGRRVFQPISVDHAFSGRVNELFLQTAWDDDDRGYKSDLKMLSTVITNQIPICQSFIAHPRLSTVGKLDVELDKAFSHTAKALFSLMIETAGFWRQTKRSKPTILSGVDESPQNVPPQVEVNRDSLLEDFIDLGPKCRGAWKRYLSPALNLELGGLLAEAENGGQPALDAELWRAIIFEAALAFRKLEADQRSELAYCLTPLFFLKGLTIYLTAEKMSESQYHAHLESEALCFETGLKELAKAWTD